MLAATIPQFQLNWIIDARWDVTCFIGAAALGYGLFFLHGGLHVDMVTVWFLNFMLMDSPHFFGTYTRTYLDREEMQTRRRLLLGSLTFFAVGPAIVLMSYALWSMGFSWHKVPVSAFTVFVSLWAYWHVTRQHFGIMSLCKRKSKDGDATDLWLDRWVIYLGLIAPFVALVVSNQETRAMLGLSSLYERGVGWEYSVVWTSFWIALGAITVLLSRQVYRWYTGQMVNVGKVLFLLAIIPLHMVLVYHPAAATLPLLGFVACILIVHDLQYHAIVYFHQKNRMKKSQPGENRFGMAETVSKNFPTYMAWGITIGVGAGLLACMTDIKPGCIPLLQSTQISLFGNVSLQELLYSVFLGFLMHHYFVDQFIWRTSKDKSLRQDLKLQTPNR